MRKKFKRLTKSSISEQFPGSSSEDDLRDFLKTKWGWNLLSELVGCNVDDIKKVEKKIKVPGCTKEGDLLVTLKNDDKIYVELQREKYDPSHHDRTMMYTIKFGASMGVLVAESIDEGWLTEMKMIYDDFRLPMSMRELIFYTENTYDIGNTYGVDYNQLQSNNSYSKRNPSNLESIDELFKKGWTRISRKYDKKYYEGKITTPNTIRYKGNDYDSYNKFSLAVAPKTNPHYQGEQIFVHIDGEWVRVTDL